MRYHHASDIPFGADELLARSRTDLQRWKQDTDPGRVTRRAEPAVSVLARWKLKAPAAATPLDGYPPPGTSILNPRRDRAFDMRSEQLIRGGGWAAMLAGVLRTAASLWPSVEPGVTLEIFYLVIDVLILFGILAIYASQHERLGRCGFMGFLLSIIGTAIIAGPDGTIGAVDMYAAGSLSLSVGLVFLAVASWTPGTLPAWVAILWVVSTVVGVCGAAAGLHALFAVAGVTFGLAFIGAGARLLSDVSSRRR